MLSLAGCSGCVVPPPLSVAADAGPDSPPAIIDLRDSSLNSHHPPDTLTVNKAQPSTSFGLTLYDTDLDDELGVQVFVQYDPQNPLPPRVTCTSTQVPDMLTNRSATCTTQGLCTDSDVGLTRRLEFEVYDRAVLPNAPYRDDAPGMANTWTFDLLCINQP